MNSIKKIILRSNDGFTLIEAMIAMVVLLLGILGVLSMQYYAVRGNAVSRELRIATNLTNELVEQMKATQYVNLATTLNQPVPVADNALLGGIATFTRSWWVVPDCVGLALGGDTGQCTGLAAVCVDDPDPTAAVPSSAVRSRTCWTDKHGVIRSVTLDTVRWNENVIP